MWRKCTMIKVFSAAVSCFEVLKNLNVVLFSAWNHYTPPAFASYGAAQYSIIIYMEYIRNKKAGFDYQIQDMVETGIELLGTEVKSVKAQHGSLAGSYVTALGGELYLLGAHIPAWQEKNVSSAYDPYRTRKLLVRNKELLELVKVMKTKGLTVIPISLYSKGSLIKLNIAIVKGKNKADKRNTLKERADKKDMDRAIKETK